MDAKIRRRAEDDAGCSRLPFRNARLQERRPFNDNIQRQGSYGLLGTRIEFGPSDRRWTLGAYARNLTNTDYITASFGTVPTAFGGRPGAPRQFSVEFRLQR